MERRSINLVVALMLVLGIGAFVWFTKDAAVSSMLPGDGQLSLVASHNSRASCWTVINGNVYDLTGWIPEHPGGEDAILQLCGTDGSDTFNGMHGGSSQQEAILAGFRINAVTGTGVGGPGNRRQGRGEEEDPER